MSMEEVKTEKLKNVAKMFGSGCVSRALNMPGTNVDRALKSALDGKGQRFVMRRHLLALTWNLTNSYEILPHFTGIENYLEKAVALLSADKDNGVEEDEVEATSSAPDEVSHVAVSLPYEKKGDLFCSYVRDIIKWAAIDQRIIRLTIHQNQGLVRAHWQKIAAIMEKTPIERNLSLQFEVLVLEDSDQTLQVVFTDQNNPPVEVPTAFVTFDGCTNGFPPHLLRNVHICVEPPASYSLQGLSPTYEKWKEALG